MKEMTETQDMILSQIGLKRHMISKAPDYEVYDKSLISSYISSEYQSSNRKETDEAFRMFEITLLHKQSGLRLSYTTTESYDGETVEYKMIDIFIRTPSKITLQVVNVDFEKKVVFTEAEIIPFNNINKAGND